MAYLKYLNLVRIVNSLNVNLALEYVTSNIIFDNNLRKSDKLSILLCKNVIKFRNKGM